MVGVPPYCCGKATRSVGEGRRTEQMEEDEPRDEESAQRQAPKVEPEAADLPRQEPDAGPSPQRTEG